jgi:hypothetical protein
MKQLKIVAIVLVAYVGLVAAFETLVGVMGSRHANRGVATDENWVLISTTAADGSRDDAVVAGLDFEGHLYVAANHWMHGWYDHAVEHLDVEVVVAGRRAPYLAVQVTGDERARVAAASRFPWVMRLLTGFPPRSFLRLDPR